MLQWRLLTPAEMADVYENQMRRDFPPEELKPLAVTLELMERGDCRSFGVFELPEGAQEGSDGVLGTPAALTERPCTAAAPEPEGPAPLSALVAYLLVVRPAPCRAALLDYFAVLPAHRSRGLGAQLLDGLRARMADTDGILIESEWPARAADPAMARRRLGFYARAGAADTGWHNRAYGGYFNVLLLPCGPQANKGAYGPFSADEAARQLALCYRQMLPGETYQKEFELFRAEKETENRREPVE